MLMEPYETLYLRGLQADYKLYQERITTLDGCILRPLANSVILKLPVNSARILADMTCH